MDTEEMRKILRSFCDAEVEHYLDIINDSKTTPVKPTEQEELLADFCEFIQQIAES